MVRHWTNLGRHWLDIGPILTGVTPQCWPNILSNIGLILVQYWQILDRYGSNVVSQYWANIDRRYTPMLAQYPFQYWSDIGTILTDIGLILVQCRQPILGQYWQALHPNVGPISFSILAQYWVYILVQYHVLPGSLKDPIPRFQGQAILWRWISPKLLQILQNTDAIIYNTN